MENNYTVCPEISNIGLIQIWNLCCIIGKESAESFEPFKVVVLSKSKSSDKESPTSKIGTFINIGEEQRIKLINS